MTKDQPSILSFFKSKAEHPKDAPPTAQRQATGGNVPPAPIIAPSRYAPPPSTSKPPPSTTKPTAPIPSPHPSATIAPITAAHIASLRRLNSLLLPIAYTDSFYTRLLEKPTYSRGILWSDPDAPSSEPKLVGAIVCRLEPANLIPVPTRSALYIQSLCLLSPYRKLGLAEAALEDVVRNLGAEDATNVYAHVWTENEDGLRWYEQRGFKKSGGRPVEGYYHRLDPSTAWIVRREIGDEAKGNTARANGQAVAAHEQGTNKNTPPPITTAAPPRSQPPPTSKSPPSSTPTPPTGPSPGGPPRPGMPSGQSFQNARPETEWNDLPADMMTGAPSSASASARASRNTSSVNLLSTGDVLGAPPSAPSSRSSSTAPRKKRAYPAAAFGTGK